MKILKLLIVLPLALLLVSCAPTIYVDTACDFMPVGTMHRDDTPMTQSWMIDYETARQRKCADA